MLGCGGHYPVGGMSDESLQGAAAGTSAGGGMGSVMPTMPEDGELGSQCVPGGMPKDLQGMLALPAVVWDRLAPVIWGEAAPPPSASRSRLSTKRWPSAARSPEPRSSCASGCASPNAPS